MFFTFYLQFNRLVHVLRDFQYDLVKKDGNPLSRKEYLEEYLTPEPEEDKINLESSHIKINILKYFVKQHLFTIDCPAGSMSLLKRLPQLDDDKLSKDFLIDMEKFQAYIHSGDNVKKLANRECNGRSKYISCILLPPIAYVILLTGFLLHNRSK